MSKVGIGGLVCGILGLVMIIVAAFLPFMLFALGLPGVSEVVAILMNVLEFAGLGLGALGLILGIVGAVKDEKKAPGIVGIVFGSIATFIAIMILGMVPMLGPI
jgi:accessory gene regulator protein AgrB